MKKVITIFCFIVLSAQILPVKQLGKCIAENQWAEEEACKQGAGKVLDFTRQPGVDMYNLYVPEHMAKSWLFVIDVGLVQAPLRTIVVPPPNQS